MMPQRNVLYIDQNVWYHKREGQKVHELGYQQGSLGRAAMEETRKCRKCLETKPIDQFPIGFIKNGIEYRRHSCVTCESLRKKVWYNTNFESARYNQNRKAKLRYNADKQKYRTRSAEWARYYREIYLQKVLDAYGRKCACCGEMEEKFLSIDHLTYSGYQAKKQGLHPKDSYSFYRWLVKNNFPPDFQLLCMNCNWGKMRNHGVCPHQEPSTIISKESRAKRPEAPSSSKEDEDMISTSVETRSGRVVSGG
jgi:hypothetical protein